MQIISLVYSTNNKSLKYLGSSSCICTLENNCNRIYLTYQIYVYVNQKYYENECTPINSYIHIE